LAQVAALGTTFAFLLGHEHDDPRAYAISLAATIGAALFLAVSNRLRRRMSQEAVIGIIYAFASAGVVLIVDKLSHGAEHIKHALVGQILWVTWHDVARVAMIYGAVAAAHFLFRRPLIDCSFGERDSWLWDFVFYALFGVVITSSVQVAGVLIVFAFLIVPAMLGGALFQGILPRLLFGWGLGFALSAAGMSLSYVWDVPAGALIVALFTAVPLLAVPVIRLLGLETRGARV